MAGWLDRGFERNTAGLLGSQTDPQTLDLMRSQYKRAAIADMVGSISGRNPGYLKNTMGGFEGLLDAQLKQQQRGAVQRQGAEQRAGIHGLLEAGYIDAPTKLMLDKMDPKSVAEILTKAHDPYTLSAEQGRYFGLGPNPIAERGPKAPEDFTLGSGQTRFNPDGTPIAQLGTNEQRNAHLRGETENAREQKIRELVEQGYPREQAARVVDGQIRVVTDPVTGRTQLVDAVDGTGRFIETSRPVPESGASAATGPTSSVTPGVDVQTLTEIPGAARRLANKVSDVIGLGPVSQPTAEAAADMRQWYQLGRLRLASAITDDRRSNMVLEMLDDVFINPDKLFMGGEDTLLKLESLDRSLGQISSEFDQVLGNPYSSSVKDVQSAENRKRMIDSVREDIRVMVEGYGQRGANVEGAAPDAGAVQDGYQFLGGDPADPSRWRKVQ